MDRNSQSLDVDMKIIASGTFDHLHDGHKLFLRTAFEKGYVMIGLSTQSLIGGKACFERLEDYETRRRNLLEWLSSEGLSEGEDYVIIPIDKPHGFACELEDIDAILVTDENSAVATSINLERASKGLRGLKVVHCRLLKDDKGKISSTRKRMSSSL